MVMNYPVSTLILCAVFFMAAITVFTAGYVAWAILRRVQIDEICLFFGPAVFRGSVAGIPFRINAYPLGSAVKFKTHVEAGRTRGFMT